MYTLHRETTISTSLEKAWAFICNPANLNLITPEDMRFEIRSNLPARMYEGMLVEYRVKLPLIGRQSWLSELKHIQEGRSFVDEQKIGPYRLWYHYHGVEQDPGGVRFIDHVTYEVPFGIIGRLVHVFFIRRTLERIFDYREQQLKKLLSAG